MAKTRTLPTDRASDARSAILLAAKQLIIQSGFAGTSLDKICEVAACSKSSIYEQFGSKAGLLAALSEDVALELSQALHAFHSQNLELDEALLRYAGLAVQRVLGDSHIAIVRATISAAWEHPEVGRAYYDVGAGAGRRALAGYLEDQVAAGHLTPGDASARAKELQGLLFWDRMLQQLVGATQAPSAKEALTHATQCVDLFLGRYATTTNHITNKVRVS